MSRTTTTFGRTFARSQATGGSDGFTLIELMVVVATIGILANVALPSYKRFQGQARAMEGDLNRKHLIELANSNFLDEGQYSSTGFRMGADVYGTGVPCFVPNDLGFRLVNCEHSNFEYSYAYSSTNAASIGIEAGTSLYPGCMDPFYMSISLISGKLSSTLMEGYGGSNSLSVFRQGETEVTFREGLARACP